LCKHICCKKVLLNGILDYVVNLSTYYMTKNEHVERTKFEFNLVLEHYNLPFSNHPRVEFGVKISSFMIFFNFIVL
jgi:hypothetical protein